MNAQQLKNSILQEAIQGRLVPQDASHCHHQQTALYGSGLQDGKTDCA